MGAEAHRDVPDPRAARTHRPSTLTPPDAGAPRAETYLLVASPSVARARALAAGEVERACAGPLLERGG